MRFRALALMWSACFLANSQSFTIHKHTSAETSDISIFNIKPLESLIVCKGKLFFKVIAYNLCNYYGSCGMYGIILQLFKKWCGILGWVSPRLFPKPKIFKILDLPAMCVIQAVGGTMAGGLRLTRQCPPQTGNRDMPSLRSEIRCWWGQTLNNTSSGTPHQKAFSFENYGICQEAHHHLELSK